MTETKNQEEAQFINLLVQAMTGYSMDQIPPENSNIVESCWNIYKDSLHKYFIENFSEKDWIQLQVSGKYSKPDLKDKPELLKKYSEAHQAFLDQLKTK